MPPSASVGASAQASAAPVASAAASAVGTTEIAASLEFSEEADAAVEQTVVAADGGTVQATGSDGTTYSLEVPAGLLVEDTLIRLTPLADVQGVGGAPAHAVRLEPEGLQFLGLTRLTITPATPIPLNQQVMFHASGTGDGVIAALVDPASEPIVILLDHFSVAGAGLAQGQASWLIGQAMQAQQRISHEIGKVLQSERRRQLAGEQSSLPLDEIERLLEQADRDVLGPLREASLLACVGATTYVQTILSLERQRQLLGLGDEDSNAAAITEAMRVIDAAFVMCEREAIAKCRVQPDPAILVGFWIGWDRQRELLGMEALNDDISVLPEKAIRTCGAFALEFSGQGFSLRTPGMGTNTLLDIVGRVNGCWSMDGSWKFSGTSTLTYRSDVVADRQEERSLFDVIGGQTPEAFEVELSQASNPEEHLLLYPRGGNWSSIAFRDARTPTPAGTLTFWNALDEHVGDFPLEVSPIEPVCE